MSKRYPGKRSDWFGYDRYDFTVAGNASHVVVPKAPAPQRPWIWRARFPDAWPQADVALLAKGIHVAYTDVAGLFGEPAAVRRFDVFYRFATRHLRLAKKPVLEGFSRGGLIIYNWAARNARKVSCIYADAPVCDIRSWPGSAGGAEWQQCLAAYGLTETSASTFRGNPINGLAPLAAAKIDLLHVVGAADRVVPVAENTDVLAKRYRKLGGHIEIIRKPACGHHPHSLEDPTPIVNFVLRHTPGMADAVEPDPRGRTYHVLRDGLGNCRARFEKARRGRVVFLGGSITAGDGWRDIVCDDLRRRFPAAKLDLVNAGIPSVDSTGDAFRLQRDVLRGGRVDLLFIDASVNDAANGRTHRERIRAMEGIVRTVRQHSPAADIVTLCFAHKPFLPAYAAGHAPPVIADHLAVARRYGLVSVDLAREVAARIADGEFAWDLFGDCHPSDFGHRLYAASIRRMLDTAWKDAAPKAGAPKAHRLPKPIDAKHYSRGRLVDISRARLGRGWKLVKRWSPTDGVGGREGFVKVPTLVATDRGAELSLAFEGTAAGVFINSGPDAGAIDVRVDDGPWRTIDTFTAWSAGLHLPWALVPASGLATGKHCLRLRTSGCGDRCACRIVHFLVSGPGRRA